MEKVNRWCLYNGPNLYEFESKGDMEFWLETKFKLEIDENIEIKFSGHKEFI